MNFYFTLTERVLLFGGGHDDMSGSGVGREGRAVNEHRIACYTGSKTIKGEGRVKFPGCLLSPHCNYEQVVEEEDCVHS